MHSRASSQRALLPLALLVLCSTVLLAASAPPRHGGTVPLSASESTPYPDTNAPELGISLTPGHIVIPRLDTAPKPSDFTAAKSTALARRMLRIGTFIQRYPNDGAPATESTQAYLAYTHDALFVAFVCTDKNPALIRAHMLARDSLADDDSVQFMLDTFHDRRRAFVFAANPLGIQSDALFSEQDGFDFSFDTVWDSWGQRTPTGYTVLFRIPFTSLYFKNADPRQLRTWGIILQRNVAHSSENDFWPRSNHNIAGRLTQDMAIEGFRDIEPGQNFQLEPYALARNLRQLNSINPVDPYFEDKHLQGYAGLDAKFILHDSLVLDTTVNPDFSQVGIDNPAIPNQRFPSYFPEVRPFFIENSSYFATPISLYYTDNIVKPQYGARLTGKLSRWALGLLGVDDRFPGEAVPPDDPQFNDRAEFYIGRVNRDLGSLSNIGLIYTDREYKDSFNRVGGLDYRLRLHDRWTVTGQGLTSQTRNFSDSTQGEQDCETDALTCSGQLWLQELSYSDLHWNGWAAYTDTSAGFVTDTGFFQRPDIRLPNGHLGYVFHPVHGPILSHGPNFYTERIWDHTGLPLDFYFIPSYYIDFRHNTSFSAALVQGQDRLRPIDDSAVASNVEFHSSVGNVSLYSAPVPYLAMGLGYSAGNEINYSPPGNQGPGPVDISAIGGNLEVKPFRPIDLRNNYVYTHFTQPGTNALVYDNHELTSRWNYQVTRAASFNLIGQYISTLPHPDLTSVPNTKTLFADALFTYMPHPGTALYFGYLGNFANLDRALCIRQSDGECNTNQPILPTATGPLMNDGKTIYIKLSYLLRY